jgi:Protein of unknown function (DUF3306)
MSGSENIFARWSRLKRELEEKRAEKALKKDNPARLAPKTEERAAPPETELVKETVDLPSVDSITTGSQVGAFLKSGVPAELARTALRRAWSSEPAIRDFIGLSENAWDFNAPAGVPGFGALKAEEVVELLSQAFGERSESSSLPASESPPAEESSALANVREPETEVLEPETGAPKQIVEPGDQSAQGQPQESVSLDPGEHKPPSRRHGRALPK